jgi:hypothetical protein
MKKKILVTANDFGSSKTNPGQRPKHHFCFGDMGKKVKYQNAEIWENNAEIWSFPRASYTYAIEDTRHAHAARRPKIHGSHHQNLKL